MIMNQLDYLKNYSRKQETQISTSKSLEEISLKLEHLGSNQNHRKWPKLPESSYRPLKNMKFIHQKRQTLTFIFKVDRKYYF